MSAIPRILLLILAITAVIGAPACSNFITPTDSEAAPKPLTTSEGVPVPKKKILVLKFLNKTRHGSDELTFLASARVREALAKEPDLAPVNDDEIDGNENFINEVGEFNVPLIMEKARSHNISGVLLGTIQSINERMTGEEGGLLRMKEYTVTAAIHLSLIDSATQHELYTNLSTADVTEEQTEFLNDRSLTSFDPERGRLAVSKAVEKSLASLPEYARKLAWSGRIAKVDLHRYYINAGELTGVSRGQLLKVYENGQPIYDPESKSLLGIAPGRFKGLLKVVDYFGTDGSMAILYSGGGFKEQDRVEFFNSVQEK